MTPNHIPTYRVRNWANHFENARTRTLENMNWIPVPNKHDGEGFRTIMAQPDGISLYGAWHLILQVSSKCHPRGTLVRSDGTPVSAKVIAIKTGAKVECIERALTFLSTEIDWLERLTKPNDTQVIPGCHADDTQVIPGCRLVPTEGREGKGRELNGSEEKGMEVALPTIADASIPTLKEVLQYASMHAVTPEVAKRLYSHYEGNNGWINNSKRLINWKFKLVEWQNDNRGFGPNGKTRAPSDPYAGMTLEQRNIRMILDTQG